MQSLKDNDITLKLQWIPSHVGIQGNEEADRLAKLACVEGREYAIMPYFLEHLPDIRRLCFDKFCEYFDRRSKEKGIWYKIIQSMPPRKPWFLTCNLARKNVILSFRLRSGHYPCNYFSHLIKVSDSSNCNECGMVEDVHHLLLECVKGADERKELIDRFQINITDLCWYISILSSPASDAAMHLFRIFN